MDLPQFPARWSGFVKIVTALCCVLLMGFPLVVATIKMRGANPGIRLIFPAVLCPFILMSSGLFAVLGYSIREERLVVHRPFWTSTYPLEGLKESSFRPGRFLAGVRLCGSGGLWGWFGLFYNSEFKMYHLQGTRLEDVVVLRWDKRTLVVTPSAPAEFVRILQAAV
jgi:hypothetical protein